MSSAQTTHAEPYVANTSAPQARHSPRHQKSFGLGGTPVGVTPYHDLARVVTLPQMRGSRVGRSVDKNPASSHPGQPYPATPRRSRGKSG
jgi:hypothetical protein